MYIPIDRGFIDLDRAHVEDSHGTVLDRLTGREADLLRYMCSQPSKDLGRDTILVEAWGYAATVRSRALDTTIARLRRKVERDAASPRHLVTVHGVGYRWVPTLPRRAPAMRSLLRLADRAIDLELRRVHLDDGDTVVDLRVDEAVLLQRLADARGAWLPPRELAPRPLARRRLKHRIHALRAKLEARDTARTALESCRRRGYRLVATREWVAPIPEVLWTVVEGAGRVLNLEDCVLYLRHQDRLVQVAAWGPKCVGQREVDSPLELRMGEGIVGSAAVTGRPVCVADTRNDHRYVVDEFSGRSELAVPFGADGRVVGVLDSESSWVEAYSDACIAALSSFGSIVASGLCAVGERDVARTSRGVDGAGASSAATSAATRRCVGLQGIAPG